MKKNGVTSRTAFVSWSGTRSIKFASFIGDWIPRHLPGAATWATFRGSDLEQGKPDYHGITKAALRAGACVCIVTPDNADRPWMGFEAGMFVARRRNVFTLLCGIDLNDLRGEGHPLGHQNATLATLVSVRALLGNLNTSLDLKLSKANVRKLAEPAFEEYLMKYEELYPELSEAERETRGFIDTLVD